MEKFNQSVLIRKLDVLCSLHNRRFMREASLTRHFTRSANRQMREGEKTHFLLPRLTLPAKCRVRLAWLIKRLLRKLK